MEICETPIFPTFEGTLRCSVQGFPVNRQAWPGSEEARLTSVGSGRQCSMLLDVSSPLGVFSKILLESSLWTSSREYCYVWQIWDTKSGFSAFRLTPLGQSTDESEFSLLGTVMTSDGGPNAHTEGVKQTLNRLWRTPNTFDHLEPKSQEALDHEKEATHSGAEPNNLRDQVAVRAGMRLWRTPDANCHRDPEGTGITGKKPDGSKAQIDLREFAIRTDASASGSLNPRFVEELMGFPIDHTALRR